ncbi:MAG: 50S ribosomal protein L4, partial [Deltaproteobacteria bacterium]
MELLITGEDGNKANITLPSSIFNVDLNESLLHQVVVSYLGNSHSHTKKHKSFSEVSGGGKKPWR